ncbi:MAG: 30S ribosomal protein S12 methylthiotransferase RimO, partial [Candidatus Krumholzibacteria bacterium]|nr:30S ribosomal protein S12 methylthiotransferase RimO [Candidatus Krumholzibacteria bacterium]
MNERLVYLESLGCSKNLVDSEATLGFLLKAGYRLQADPDAADLILLNTCGFVEDAKRQSIERILELA